MHNLAANLIFSCRCFRLLFSFSDLIQLPSFKPEHSLVKWGNGLDDGRKFLSRHKNPFSSHKLKLNPLKSRILLLRCHRLKEEIMKEVQQEFLVTKTLQEIESNRDLDVNFVGVYITSEDKVSFSLEAVIINFILTSLSIYLLFSSNHLTRCALLSSAIA